MKITVISGGVGGARFLRGVRAHVREAYPDGAGGSTASITAVVNTGDDMWLTGVRIAPDLDSIMYTLAGENDEVRGWGRVGESERVSAELRAYGVGWPWFTLGDLDLGTHLARTSLLRDGLTLAEATERITSRWPLGVRLMPATNDEVETHVVTDDGHRPALPGVVDPAPGDAARRASSCSQASRSSSPAPGVLDAITDADVVLLAPSNPVVSIGTVLGIPGIRDAVRDDERPGGGRLPHHRRRGRARDGGCLPHRDRRRDGGRRRRPALRRAHRPAASSMRGCSARRMPRSPPRSRRRASAPPSSRSGCATSPRVPRSPQQPSPPPAPTHSPNSGAGGRAQEDV